MYGSKSAESNSTWNNNSQAIERYTANRAKTPANEFILAWIKLIACLIVERWTNRSWLINRFKLCRIYTILITLGNICTNPIVGQSMWIRQYFYKIVSKNVLRSEKEAFRRRSNCWLFKLSAQVVSIVAIFSCLLAVA